MMKTKMMLEESIQKTIEEVDRLEIGSEEHKKATDTLVKLLDKYNQMDQLDAELQDKYDTREAERVIKEKQLEFEKKDARIKNILNGVSVIVGGIAVPVWATLVALTFEKVDDGLFSAITSKDIIKNVLPRRK